MTKYRRMGFRQTATICNYTTLPWSLYYCMTLFNVNVFFACFFAKILMKKLWLWSFRNVNNTNTPLVNKHMIWGIIHVHSTVSTETVIVVQRQVLLWTAKALNRVFKIEDWCSELFFLQIHCNIYIMKWMALTFLLSLLHSRPHYGVHGARALHLLSVSHCAGSERMDLSLFD